MLYEVITDKGLDILEYLSLKSIPQSQSEISQGIGKSPSEIYRMLSYNFV